MLRLLVSVYVLILQINFIRTDCERINENNLYRVKCYSPKLNEINAIKDSDIFTELEVLNGKLPDLGRNALNYPRLSKMKLLNSGIQTIQTETFMNLPSLIYLDLSNNKLKTLPSKLFQNNVQLRVLNISSNAINMIHRDTFTRLPDLVELRLDDNQLKVIKNIFNSLTQLESLYLTANKILVIEPETFTENVNLKTLHLNYNPLTDLQADTFLSDTHGIANTYVAFQAHSSTITELNLALCNLKILKNHYFVYLRRLKFLSLLTNEISEFESEDIFKENKRLETLIMSYNQIKSLPSRIFQSLRNLKSLTLHQNQLVDLPVDLFKRNLKLETLHLSYNSIAKLDARVFRNLKNLLYLNLEGNALTEVPKDVFEHLSGLKDLFLTRNEITYIEPGSFDSLSHLKTLYLYQNQLKEIGPNVFFKLIELNTLGLDANGLSDIKYGTFNSFHDGYSDETSRILKLSIAGCNISHLSYSTFAPLSRLISFDISYCKVRNLDKDLFKSMGDTLTILKMSGNKLKHLENGVFDQLENVIQLDLDRNQLTNLDDDLFKNMLSLEKINLAENKLKTISPEVFDIPNLLEVNLNENELTYLPPNMFEGEDCIVERFLIHGNKLTYLDNDFLQRSKLKFFRFGRNPWQCGCLNEVMNDVYRLNIEIEMRDYFDGTNPICVVTENNTCIREPYLTDELNKKYLSIHHNNVIW